MGSILGEGEENDRRKNTWTILVDGNRDTWKDFKGFESCAFGLLDV